MTAPTAIGEEIHRRIEDKREALVALTQDLIRIPTVNPPGNAYEDCVRYLGKRLEKRGFQVTYLRAEGTPGDNDRHPRWNVIARREGSRPGPCVHFNSHIDVVPPGEGWTKDPFGAEIQDGKIYGRGSCDMKGGLAASVIAVEAFLETVPEFPGAIEISGTADEETGGLGGVAYLARQGFFSKPRVDHVIIPEPLNKERICLGHRGLWWAKLETHGRIAHGSMPFLGDSAIRHMGAVLAAFEKKLFPALEARQTQMPVVPDGARRSTLNLNGLHGGQGEDFEGLPASCVPDSCRLILDRRFLIEESLAAVKAEITDILDELAETRAGFRYTLTDLLAVEPTMTDRNAPVVRAVAAAVEKVLAQTPDYVISPGTYDQKHIVRIGHLQDCIAYGPGILDLAHQPDEFIVIDDMVDSAKVMALALDALLGGRSGPA